MIEIGARGGGNFISSHIVPAMTGFDNYKILTEQTLGTKTDFSFNPDNHSKKCAVLEFLTLIQQIMAKKSKLWLVLNC